MMRLTPLLALLIALPATAQDIPAQAAVGQCYSACITTVLTGQERVETAIGRYDELVYWNAVTLAEGKNLSCASLQGLAIEANVCYAGCRDVEAGYGSVNSQAENIVNGLLQREGPLHRSGLYPDDRPHPRVGTPQFTAACNRLFGTAAGAQSSSITKLLGQAKNKQAEEMPEALIQP